jgi:hypothetical protein
VHWLLWFRVLCCPAERMGSAGQHNTQNFGNFVVSCGPGTYYFQTHIFQCMLERTDAITYEVLEATTFVLAYPTVC